MGLAEGISVGRDHARYFWMWFRRQIGNWHEYLADLSDLESAKDLSAEQVAMCSVDGKTIQVMPMVMEGWGILYNMKYLNQVGWDEAPGNHIMNWKIV